MRRTRKLGTIPVPNTIPVSLDSTPSKLITRHDASTFAWEWGDGTPVTATTYFNDGIGPDPYPSPGGTFPFTATDRQTHVYAMVGTYDLSLIVRDDDGGKSQLLVVVVII